MMCFPVVVLLALCVEVAMLEVVLVMESREERSDLGEQKVLAGEAAVGQGIV